MVRLNNISAFVEKFLILSLFLCIATSVNAQDLQYYKTSSGKYGYKDKYGNVVIQPRFEDAWNFADNGLAAVELNGKWGFINKTGTFVIQPQFGYAHVFANNGLAAVSLNGKYGFIDKTGRFVIQPQFSNASHFASNGLAAVALNGKWGYIDESAKFVIQPQFSNASHFASNGLAAVALNGKWGYIDESAKFVIQPQFGYAHVFANNGLASVKLNGKWGYIDETATFVIQPQFSVAMDFSENGIAKVRLDSVHWEYVDESGNSYATEELALAEEKQRALAAKEKRAAEEKKRLEEEQKYSVRVGESYTAYINRLVPTWGKYLQEKDVVKPVAPSTESVKQTVEKEVNAWQQKGEFETTAAWRTRVNDATRAAKVNEITQRIAKEYSTKVANYNTRISQLRSKYEAEYKKASDWYCTAKAKKFAKQSFELKPYDADNGTFLISSATGGDILLPVPLANAQQFKANWSSIKTKVTAEFVPTGNDVALKSVTFGDYTYDGNTKANYAVTNIDYNFAPIEISNLDLAISDYNFDQISSAPAVTVSNPDAKTISASKATPESRTLSAGSASDVDLNIPQSKVTAKNTFAIVIANENYQNVERVEDAANDGKIIAKYFTSALGIPQDQVMTYTDASYGNMIDALDRIKNISQAYRGSDYNVIFYYAGHGVPDEQSHEAFLLPTDGKPGSSAVNISLSKLYSTLGNLGASAVYVMLDACFSGSQRGDGMLAQARGVAIKAKAAEPNGNMVVLSAAQGDETAYPYKGQNHGMFTYYLLKKLQASAGNVTIGELADYVIDNVKKTSVIKNNGKIQTPTVRASLSSGESWRNNKLVK
jgi:hypothetical protein